MQYYYYCYWAEKYDKQCKGCSVSLLQAELLLLFSICCLCRFRHRSCRRFLKKRFSSLLSSPRWNILLKSCCHLQTETTKNGGDQFANVLRYNHKWVSLSLIKWIGVNWIPSNQGCCNHRIGRFSELPTSTSTLFKVFKFKNRLISLFKSWLNFFQGLN